MVEKIRLDGRVWNCYLCKYEDECTEEEIQTADEIIDLDRQMLDAHGDELSRLKAKKRELMAKIDIERDFYL